MRGEFQMPAGSSGGMGSFSINGPALDAILSGPDGVPTVARAAPKQWGEPVSFKAPEWHRAALREFANRHRVSMSAVLRAAVAAQMEAMGMDPIAADGADETKVKAIMLDKTNRRDGV